MRMRATAGARLLLLLLPLPSASPAARAETAPPRLPRRLAVETEGAFGTVTGRFYNQLAGLRVDGQFSPHVFFGGYLGYANLKGKDGRVHDAIGYAQVEYLAGDPSAVVRVPFRFASGYLPRNGPVARLATGLAFAVSPGVDLTTELVAPMIWLSHDQMLLSMNLSIELAVRF